MKRKTNEEFLKEIYDQVGDEYIPLEEYKGNNKTPILMMHNSKECKYYKKKKRFYKWKVTPDKFLNKRTRCKYCAGQHKRTHEEFLEDIFDEVGNEYEVLTEFKNISTHVKMRHNSKNCEYYKQEGKYYEWDILPNNFIRLEERCPKCALFEKESKAVTFIKEFLNKNKIEYYTEIKLLDFSNIKRFDFYIPNLNLIIEYDGGFHFFNGFSDQSLINQKNNDKEKNEFIFNNKIINNLKINNNILNNISNLKLLRISFINESSLLEILNNIIIEKSSTTIEKYQLLEIEYQKYNNYENYYLNVDKNYFN